MNTAWESLTGSPDESRQPGHVLVAAALVASGVKYVAGIPGVQNLPLYTSLANTDSLNTLLVCNEQSIGPMALGYEMSRDESQGLFCANVIGGPGVTHALGGIYMAAKTNTPMLLLCTGIKKSWPFKYQLHDVDNLAVLSPICKATFSIEYGSDIPSTILNAIKIAYTEDYGPVAVEIPSDLLTSMHLFSPKQVHVQPAPMKQFVPSKPPSGTSEHQDIVNSLKLGENHAVVTEKGLISAALGIKTDHFLSFDSPGFVVPAAIGVALTNRSVVAFTTEESMRMSGLELISAPQLDVRVVVAGDGFDNAMCCNIPISTNKCEYSDDVCTALASSLCNADISHVYTHSLVSLDGLTVIQTVDDQSTGFCADGYYRSSGKLACALVSDDYNAATVLSGIGESMMDSVATLLVVVGDPAISDMAQPLTKAWFRVGSLNDIDAVIARASSIACSGCPGPVVVNIALGSDNAEHVVEMTDNGDMMIEQVADALMNAKQPLIYVGIGAAASCQKQLIDVVERTGSLVVTTLSGKGVFPETHPQWLWSGIGAVCPPPLKAIVDQCDMCLIVGARMSELGAAHYRLQLPSLCYHVDIDPNVPGANFAAHGIVCDSRVFLDGLMSALHGNKPCRSLAEAHDQVNTALQQPCTEKVSPHALFSTLQQVYGDAVFVTDSGNGTVLASEHLRLTKPRTLLSPTDYSSMGYAVPAALGAACHGSRSVAIVGDGALLMTGMEAFTAVTHELPLTIIVLRDGELGLMSSLQRSMGQQPFCTTLPQYSVESIAHSCKAPYRLCSSDSELVDALKWCSQQGTSILEVKINYDRTTFYSSGVLATPLVLPPEKLSVDDGCGSEWDAWDILRRAASLFGGKTAFDNVTYYDWYLQSCSVAHFMRDNGIKPGDRIGILADNVPAVLVAHYASAALRTITLNLNTGLTVPELGYILENADPVWIIASIRMRAVLTDALSDCNVKGVLWIDASDGLMDFVVASRYRMLPFTPTVSVDNYPGFQMYYTSGTTGHPKGVVLSHQIVCMHALAANNEFGIVESDIWGHFAPLFHVVDAFAVYSLTWVGGKHVLLPRWDTAAAMEFMEKENVTITNLGSAQMVSLMNSSQRSQHDFSAMRLISCGGGAVPDEIVRRMEQTFGCTVFLSYGMTECCGKISFSLLTSEIEPKDRFMFLSSAGRPFMLMDIRIDGDDVGEIQLRGPTVFNGYWNNDEATKSSFTEDGWFKTGDLAMQLPHGYLRIVDRKKDMINVGGENVYSVEVENVLCNHPAIAISCVYGYPDQLLGEIVKAVMVLNEGFTAPSSSEMIDFCSQRLAAYKVPVLIEYVSGDSLPRTGTGKIMKGKMRKQDIEGQPRTSPVSDYPNYHVTWREAALSDDASAIKHWLVVGHCEGLSLCGEVTHAKSVEGRHDGVVFVPSDNIESLRTMFDITKALLGNPCTLIILTLGKMGPVQSALCGFARVLAAESPRIRVRSVHADEMCDAVTTEIESTSVEEQVWIRDGSRHIARLAQWQPPSMGSFECDPDGAYILTGGLGRLGRIMTQWLIGKCGARRVVLVDRQSRDITDLHREFPNAEITVEVCDVSSASEVAALLERTRHVKGIFHLAGALGDGTLASLDWATFDDVIHGKIMGAFNLDRESRRLGLDLDCFMMFSSVFAVFGFPELSHYASANAFLDGLSHQRRQDGLPSLAVNWGTMADVGMAHDLGDAWANHWKSMGMGFVAPMNAFDAMGSLLSLGDGVPPVMGVYPINWKVFSASSLSPKTTLFADLSIQIAQAPVMKPSLQTIEEIVKSEIADVLHRDIDGDAPFMEQGVDSMMSTRLRLAIGRHLGVELDAATLVEHSTLNQLVAHLSKDAHVVDEVSLIVEEVSKVLGNKTVNQDQLFNELGLDSMLSVRLRLILEERLGLSIEPSAFMEFPTIEKLGKYLHSMLYDAPLPKETAVQTISAPEQPDAVTSIPLTMEYEVFDSQLRYGLIPWDCAAFEHPCYRIVVDGQPRADNIRVLLEQICAKHESEHVFVMCRLSNNNVGWHEAIAATGFFVAETSVDPYCNMDDIKPQTLSSRYRLVEAQTHHRSRIIDIAETSDFGGRYHADAKLSRKGVSQRYGNWVRLAHGDNDVILTFEDTRDNSVVGFYHVRRGEAGTIHLVLAAIASRMLGTGLGTMLFEHCLEWCRSNGCTRIETSISVANTAVLNLYAHFGFMFGNPEIVFHWHR